MNEIVDSVVSSILPEQRLLVGIGLSLLFIIYLSLHLRGSKNKKAFIEEAPSSANEVRKEAEYMWKYQTDTINQAIAEIPDRVLKSITSSANVKKGALGELVGYLELKASYDRIIPLGNIVDFIGIKFRGPDGEGHIDFIDIKTGKSARLSKDQKALQQLIMDKHIKFVKVKVESEIKS